MLTWIIAAIGVLIGVAAFIYFGPLFFGVLWYLSQGIHRLFIKDNRDSRK